MCVGIEDRERVNVCVCVRETEGEETFRAVYGASYGDCECIVSYKAIPRNLIKKLLRDNQN